MLRRSRVSVHLKEAPGSGQQDQKCFPGGTIYGFWRVSGTDLQKKLACPALPLSRAMCNTQEGLSKHLLNECSVEESDGAFRELRGPAWHGVSVTFLTQGKGVRKHTSWPICKTGMMIVPAL